MNFAKLRVVVWSTALAFMGLYSSVACALEFSASDANFKQCLIALAQKNNWASFDSVTKIECHSKKIAVLDGLEQFPKLQSLSVYNNQITQISVKNLTNLRYLNVAKNAITSFELVNLPALEELLMFNNKLTDLALKNLPKLKLFKANENQLLTFTYSELPELEKIYIFNNKLVTMDIYHLPKMHYVDCRQNPMPAKLYDEMDAMKGVTFLHDGNAKDW
jgi:protein phosphatase 1 regulatory subunit 7